MAVTWPAYGDERFVLHQRGRGFRLVREIFTETGFSTTFDEDDKNWKTHKGSWDVVESLGTFDTAEDARQFLIARTDGDTRQKEGSTDGD